MDRDSLQAIVHKRDMVLTLLSGILLFHKLIIIQQKSMVKLGLSEPRMIRTCHLSINKKGPSVLIFELFHYLNYLPELPLDQFG